MWFVLMMMACTVEPETNDTDSNSGVDTEDVSGTDPDSASIDIAGSWVDNYGYAHVISDTSWESYDSGAPVALTQFNNAQGWTCLLYTSPSPRD